MHNCTPKLVFRPLLNSIRLFGPINLQGNRLYVVDRLLRIDSLGYHMISLPSLYYSELPFNLSLSHQSKDYIKSDL